MELISRVVGGWNVRMMLRGKRASRFFADAGHGGKKAALAAAKEFRDELLAKRPARKAVARPLVVTRSGTEWVQIRVPKVGGGTVTTEFSVRRHGMRGAKKLAVDAWNTAARKARK